MAAACALASPALHAAPHGGRSADAADQRAPDEVRDVARWVVASRDHRGLPFAIVDKRNAMLFVFGPQGQVVGATPALLGLARGDHAVPGTGLLDPARIPAADRTTPAGRFVSEPGRNLSGEDVVWFDYDAGLAIHRLRPAPARERRAQRLASSVADDNRISAGCVVVPVAFFEAVVAPTLGAGNGVVYVMPETRPAHELFGPRNADL